MARKKNSGLQGNAAESQTVIYPKHHFNDPKDLLVFLEMLGFSEEWERLGLDDERDLTALQIAIMLNPLGHPVIPGTGGLRKLRFSPPGRNQGKRGSFRVCYAYFEDLGIVILVVVYSKSEIDDLSERAKRIIRAELDQQKNLLSEGFYT